jgi:cytochrome c oxidase subunit II
MMTEVNHWRRFLLWWLGTSIVATLLVIFLLAPIVPPGNGSVEASGQVVDDTVLLGISTPIAMAVLVYFIYALIAFRERDPAAVVDGPPIRGDAKVQTWWLVATTGIVLFMAGYGTVRLLADGAGGGQGPNPIAAPAGSKDALQVQVIAQQWKFTYRWPSYGGVETPTLELPANRMIEFHVTSLDVIHSFWAYQLGVKADANPGFDNVAYVTTKGPLNFDIHCAELCGVWHGYMFESGRVVPARQFSTWIAQQRVQNAPSAKSLPPYSKQYFPDPQRRGG